MAAVCAFDAPADARRRLCLRDARDGRFSLRLIINAATLSSVDKGTGADLLDAASCIIYLFTFFF